MRSNALTRAFVSVTAIVGMAAGSLASAGTSFAAPAPATNPAVTSEEIVPLAVNNLGLSNAQAKNVQRWLQRYWGYNDSIDGLLGTNSWKAFQRCLKEYWGYTAAIDGIVGTGTIKALQRLLAAAWGYTGGIDGDAGPQTRAAFKRFADGI